jgi:hypothetical protein
MPGQQHKIRLQPFEGVPQTGAAAHLNIKAAFLSAFSRIFVDAVGGNTL